MVLFRLFCWALTFTFRLRFPLGSSIATIIKVPSSTRVTVVHYFSPYGSIFKASCWLSEGNGLYMYDTFIQHLITCGSTVGLSYRVSEGYGL